LYRAIADLSVHQLHPKRSTAITSHRTAKIKSFSTGSTPRFSGGEQHRPLHAVVRQPYR